MRIEEDRAKVMNIEVGVQNIEELVRLISRRERLIALFIRTEIRRNVNNTN